MLIKVGALIPKVFILQFTRRVDKFKITSVTLEDLYVVPAPEQPQDNHFRGFFNSAFEFLPYIRNFQILKFMSACFLGQSYIDVDEKQKYFYI